MVPVARHVLRQNDHIEMMAAILIERSLAANLREFRSQFALASAFAGICWNLDCFTRSDASCRILIWSWRLTARKFLAPGGLPSLVLPTPGSPAAGPFLPRTGRPLRWNDGRRRRSNGHRGSSM
jgi:hypothetical protein